MDDHKEVIGGKITVFRNFGAGSHRPKFAPPLTIGDTSATYAEASGDYCATLTDRSKASSACIMLAVYYVNGSLVFI